MTCPECKGEMALTKQDYQYTESGLDRFTLKDCEVYQCRKGHVVPLLPDAERLAKLIAWALVRNPERLNADSILFLRKAMGLTGEALAKRLSVSRGEVSRWENGKADIHPHNDFRLRMEVAQTVLPKHLLPLTIQDITAISMSLSPRRRIVSHRRGEPVVIMPEMAKAILQPAAAFP